MADLNWEAIGAVGEVVGAVGVIATLGYLAVQIRQNTRSIRSSAYQSAVSSSVQIAADIATAESLSDVWAKGVFEYPTLTRAERFRFNNLAYSIFRSYENLWYQYQQGAIETDLWTGFRNMLVRDIETPGFVAFWESQQSIFSPEFRRYVNELSQ